MAKNVKYPFQPKSNRSMLPGQYWAIPLSYGRFACGRVIQLPPPENKDTRGFLGALLDWSGDHPPTENDIAGCQPVVMGNAHIRVILEGAHDGMILGHRPLELDNIEPPIYRSMTESALHKGYVKLREAPFEEVKNYPYMSSLGYMYLNGRAEKLFGSETE